MPLGPNKLSRDERDASDMVDRKLRKACDMVEQGYSDRWPARGQATVPTREWRPLEDVSRGGKITEYLKRPSAPR